MHKWVTFRFDDEIETMTLWRWGLWNVVVRMTEEGWRGVRLVLYWIEEYFSCTKCLISLLFWTNYDNIWIDQYCVWLNWYKYNHSHKRNSSLFKKQNWQIHAVKAECPFQRTFRISRRKRSSFFSAVLWAYWGPISSIFVISLFLLSKKPPSVVNPFDPAVIS